MKTTFIRKAKPGDERAIHEAHMRTIREICVKDHGEDEVRGWGNRPLGQRWITPIKDNAVWVVEHLGEVHGHGYLYFEQKDGELEAEIAGLYLSPDILGMGFGKKLLALMLEKARQAGAPSVVLDSSLTAHDFYKKCGFADTGPLQTAEIGGSMVRGYPMRRIFPKTQLVIETSIARLHLNAIKALYQLCGYTGSLQEDDSVILATMDKKLVGVVRLVEEKGVAILRGMYLHPNFLRRGIGTQMLATFEHLLIERDLRNVFCICGAPLGGYYSQIGFCKIQESLAPDFLVERKNGYQAHYGAQIIMCRT